ncbi:MAG: HigA family addiction module antitoxin [Syntrophobacteraceae bacterium]|nr:HigA family addiction module antitoxin [Syntrophobacteraceae bacterium]
MIEECVMTEAPQMPPIHPGAILREDVIPEMSISVTEFAKRIGVSRQILHRILAETNSITPEMALRIGRFLGNGPGLWLRMQEQFDLWQSEQKLREVLETIKPFSEAGRV